MRRATGVLLLAIAATAAHGVGHEANVKVTAATRLDWVFVCANQSPPRAPAGWLPGYDSTAQTYERYVPRSYNPKRPAPLVVFIAPGNRGNASGAWKQACEKMGILFAGPHAAGNNVQFRPRVRIVLDVLDDMRRHFNVDPDRTYLAGFSGGGRIACAIGYALPELIGGVMPICASGSMRNEVWLRHRVRERLSVALVTGETDFNRGEVERFRGPLFKDLGVRTKVWTVPKMGHAVPSAQVIVEVHRWLDQGLAGRRKMVKQYPHSHLAGKAVPSRVEAARALLAEGKARLKQRQLIYSGLMQFKGLRTRWPDLPEAKEATQLLVKFQDQADQTWQQYDIDEQRTRMLAEARALTAYATGPLPQRYAAQRAGMARSAIQLWRRIRDDGRDPKAVKEANERIGELEKLGAAGA